MEAEASGTKSNGGDAGNRGKTRHRERLGAGDSYTPLAGWHDDGGSRVRTLDQREIAGLLTFEGGRRALQRDRGRWHRLLRAGTHGALAEYLSYGRGRWKRRFDELRLHERLPALQADLVKNFPPVLPATSTPRPSLANVIGLPALLESLVFLRFGFIPLWCEHGKHGFLSDDRRREDCLEHRVAGQRARTRARNPKTHAEDLRRRRERRRERRIARRQRSKRG